MAEYRASRDGFTASRRTNDRYPTAFVNRLSRLGWLLLAACLTLVPAPLQAQSPIDDYIARIEFRNITVGDALRILSERSGLNVVASQKAAEIPVTMFLKHVRPLDVLEAMAKTYNLWYRRDPVSGIVRVYTVEEFRLGKVDYTRERTEVFTLKNQMNLIDAATAIQDLYGKRVVLNFGSENDFQILSDLALRFQRFNIIDSQSRLSTTGNRGGVGGIGGFGMGRFGGGMGRFGGGVGGIGFGRRRQQGQAAAGRTEVRPEEVKRELGGTEELLGGVQEKKAVVETTHRTAPIYVTLIRRQNRLVVRTRDQDAVEQIRRLIKKIDTDMATLLLEVKVLQADLSDGYDSIFEFATKDRKVAVSKGDVNFATIPDTVPLQGQTGTTTTTPQTGTTATAAQTFGKLGPLLINQLAATAPAISNPALLATLVTNHIRARLQLLESEGRVSTVATPVLLTTNQEVSRIFIGDEVPITTDINVQCASNQGGTGNVAQCQFEPKTEVRNVGDTLLLTPTINADGSVNIRIVVEQAQVCPGCGKIPTPRQGIPPDPEKDNVKVDTVTTRVYTGTIVAQNGQEVAIGGLIKERAEDSERKVPVLGDIPVLGRLFRDEVRRRKRTELVILVRPHVIAKPNESQQVSNAWLRRQSVHPALGSESRSLEIYKNPSARHPGYELQEPYKFYPGQDAMDRYNRKDGYWEKAKDRAIRPADTTQRLYMELTRYAARAVRKIGYELENDLGIVRRPDLPKQPVFLTPQLEAHPLASWRRGGLTVTALRLVNRSGQEVVFDAEALHGDWLVATVEKPKLAPGERTYLYLISAGDFREALQR